MSLRSFLQDHPLPMVWAWQIGERVFENMGPFFERIGVERASAAIHPLEWVFKRLLFDCRSCGQCMLHYNGMTCPMTCPKQLRNGPCGGVRLDGTCEVYPDKACVWVKATERLARTPYTHEKYRLNPPVDWRLEGMSSYVNFATQRDQITTGNESDGHYADEVLSQ